MQACVPALSFSFLCRSGIAGRVASTLHLNTLLGLLGLELISARRVTANNEDNDDIEKEEEEALPEARVEDLTRDDLGEYRSEEDPDYVGGKSSSSSSSSSEDSEDDNKEAGIGGRGSSEDESEIEVGETADDLDKA